MRHYSKHLRVSGGANPVLSLCPGCRRQALGFSRWDCHRQCRCPRIPHYKTRTAPKNSPILKYRSTLYSLFNLSVYSWTFHVNKTNYFFIRVRNSWYRSHKPTSNPIMPIAIPNLQAQQPQ